MNMLPGDSVIISFNPHHLGANHILGVVETYRAGAGHNGKDLVDVKYTNPTDEKEYVMSFGVNNLEPITRSNILRQIQYHRKMAAICGALLMAKMKDN